jgi:hypothetical protein
MASEVAYQNWKLRNELLFKEFCDFSKFLYDAGIRVMSAQDVVATMRLIQQTGASLKFPDGSVFSPKSDISVTMSRSYIVYMARDLAIADARFVTFFPFKSETPKREVFVERF